MNYLAINTADHYLRIAVRIGEELRLHEDESPLRHSMTLMPAIERLTDGFDCAKFDFIAVCIGPGSFTGIRIGVTTAKMLAFAKHIPLLPFTTLQEAAYNKLESLESMPRAIVSVIDGGNKCCYVGELTTDMQPTSPARLVAQDEYERLRAHWNETETAVADGYGDRTYCPTARRMAELVELLCVNDSLLTDCDGAEPLYIQLSQAEKEEQEKERAAKKV